MSEYGAEQLSAGYRSMTMLAALVQRGGRPAAVAPTIALRPGEKQYGWFPVSMAGAGRCVAVITNQRLLVGAQRYPLSAITRIRLHPADWSVALEVRGAVAPVVISGPWVPWLSVVICSELYGTPGPPGHALVAAVPAPRRAPTVVAFCPGHQAG